MLNVTDNKANGTLKEILEYAWAASLSGMKANPTDAPGCDLAWNGTAWAPGSGTGLGGQVGQLSVLQGINLSKVASGVIFMVGAEKYRWNGSALSAVSAIAGDYSAGERVSEGALAAVLATSPPEGTWSEPSDAFGCRIQYKAGKWFGDFGTWASKTALTTAIGGQEARIELGSRATLPSGQVTWRGASVGWAGDPIVLDRYLRIATFGDSTADFGGPGTTDTEKMYIAFPGSGFSEFGCWQSKATLAWWQPSMMVASGGGGGQTTQQFLDRGKNAYSSTRKAMQDVLRKRPDVVLMHGGSINDYAGFSASTPQATIDAVVSRHRQCVEFFTGAGIHVIDSGTYGYSVAGPNLSAICSIIVQTNAAIKAMASQNPLWHFVDVSGVLHDGTGLYKAGVSMDNVHLNDLGGFLLGRLEKQVLDQLFVGGTSGEIIWDQQADYANYDANGPVNHSLGYGGLTVNSRTVEAGRYVVSVTVTGYENSDCTMWLDSAPTKALAAVQAGDALIFEGYIAVKDANGSEVVGLVTGNRIRIHDVTNSVSVIYDRYHGRTTGGWFSRQFSSPVAAASMGSSTQFNVGIKFPANGTYTVEFRPWRIRKYTPMNVLP